MNVATHMWVNCSQTRGLNMAAHGSTSTTCPSSSRNPVGAFIHEFTDRMQNVPTIPATPIGTRQARCTRSGSRRHP